MHWLIWSRVKSYVKCTCKHRERWPSNQEISPARKSKSSLWFAGYLGKCYNLSKGSQFNPWYNNSILSKEKLTKDFVCPGITSIMLISLELRLQMQFQTQLATFSMFATRKIVASVLSFPVCSAAIFICHMWCHCIIFPPICRSIIAGLSRARPRKIEWIFFGLNEYILDWIAWIFLVWIESIYFRLD